MASHDIYLSHRDLIERALRHVCRRQCLSKEDSEDFSSAFRVHLMEGDYAVMRAFAGRSKLETYLVTVITHYFQDWRNARWGKWRPSAEATRGGPLAVRLETLMRRDGLTFDEACETLRTNHGVTASPAELDAIAARFPPRARRTFVDDAALADGAGDLHADAPLTEQRATATAGRAAAALDAALRQMPSEDRLIITLRFDRDARVIDIATLLGVDHKALYRRIDRLLRDLRASLLSGGVDAAMCREAFDGRGFDRVEPAFSAEMPAAVRPLDRGPGPAVSSRRWP